MVTSGEHAPELDQMTGPATKSQQQSWARDLLDTIKTNRDSNRGPDAWLSQPNTENGDGIPTLAAELMANVHSEQYTPGTGANHSGGHRSSREIAIASEQVMGDASPGIRQQMAAAFAVLIVEQARAAAERRKDRDVGAQVVAMQQFIQLHLFNGDAQVYLARPFTRLTSIGAPDQ